MLAALCPPGATSRLSATGLPQLRAPEALRTLGVSVLLKDQHWVVVASPISKPEAPLQCGHSTRLLAALAGLLAAQPFGSVLEADAALAGTALANIAATLRRRGAIIEGRLDPNRVDALAPPLRVEQPPAPLAPVQVHIEAGDASSKIAALLSGLSAGAPSWIAESMVADVRCEQLLLTMGAALEASGPIVALHPGPLKPFDAELGAASDLAASLLSCALLVRDSVVGVRGVSLASRGVFDALRTAGAAIAIEMRNDRFGDACADITVRGASVAGGLSLAGEQAARAGASLPTLAVIASGCRRSSQLRELPPHPLFGDRIESTLTLLEHFGIAAERIERGIAVTPSSPQPADVHSDDPAIAMAATVLALGADGPSRIRGADCIVETFPRFVGSLRALGANIDVV